MREVKKLLLTDFFSFKLCIYQDLLQWDRLYIYPAFKLIEKTRVGSKYIKKYDSPKTPAMRLLEDPRTNRNIKKKIQLTLESINPVALALEVNNLQEKLLKHAEVLTSAYPQGKGA